jgi:hypothetical protein
MGFAVFWGEREISLMFWLIAYGLGKAYNGFANWAGLFGEFNFVCVDHQQRLNEDN